VATKPTTGVSVRAAASNPSTSTAVVAGITGLTRSTIASSLARTVALQQDCELGIGNRPHASAIRLQHSRSPGLSCRSGERHAIAGRPNMKRATTTATNLRNAVNRNSSVSCQLRSENAAKGYRTP